MTVDLKYLFEPKGVIVTGVSSHPGKFGSVALHNILSCGYAGKVFAFGREEATVLEQKVITSFDSIPSNEVDLMILCTPVGVNEELVRRASEKGIKAIYQTQSQIAASQILVHNMPLEYFLDLFGLMMHPPIQMK